MNPILGPPDAAVFSLSLSLSSFLFCFVFFSSPEPLSLSLNCCFGGSFPFRVRVRQFRCRVSFSSFPLSLSLSTVHFFVFFFFFFGGSCVRRCFGTAANGRPLEGRLRWSGGPGSRRRRRRSGGGKDVGVTLWCSNDYFIIINRRPRSRHQPPAVRTPTGGSSHRETPTLWDTHTHTHTHGELNEPLRLHQSISPLPSGRYDPIKRFFFNFSFFSKSLSFQVG